MSQAEWKKATGINPSKSKGEALPVETVSWDDCQKFCKKTGLSFPTEAQWEYACRAGTTTPYAFGETLSKEQANFWDDNQRTIAVDSFGPNGFGLHNMHGNVQEWCQDVYDTEFYKKPEATQKNPVCTSGSEHRVYRGGGWQYNPWFCRSSSRYSLLSLYGGPFFVGFRPAYNLAK